MPMSRRVSKSFRLSSVVIVRMEFEKIGTPNNSPSTVLRQLATLSTERTSILLTKTTVTYLRAPDSECDGLWDNRMWFPPVGSGVPPAV